LKVVSIMDYPAEPRLMQMCRMFLDSVIHHGGQSITLLYEDHYPAVADEFRPTADIEVVQKKSHDIELTPLLTPASSLQRSRCTTAWE
jgi:hypothetical protein